MNPKQRAAEAAMSYVKSGMVIGLGTGSTADFFIAVLADAISQGTLRDIRGVPTSRQSEQRARQLDIPLATLAECPRPDVTVDGADEIDPNLNLIKGLGGALMREKIVAQNSAKLIIIADRSKRVNVLGEKSPLPVEVAMFAHETHEKYLRDLGCEPALRRSADGSVYQTDNGNVIYDCRFTQINDPHGLETALKQRAGILESGLFLGIADLALIADSEGVETLAE